MSDYRNHSLLQSRQYVTDEQLAAEKSILALDAMERRGMLTAPPAAARRGLNRRGFLATAGIAGAAVLTGCADTPASNVTPVTGTAPTVGDVLNFALNLEYLEATFYLTLTTGSGLQAADMGSMPGAVTGGLTQVAFTLPGVQDLANQLAADEQAHVQFLRATMQALSITPVDMPALNLSAIGGVANDSDFLSIARKLETTGTSAYEGAIDDLISNVTALNYAAVIHATEGQHEAALRLYCIVNNVTSSAVDGADVPPDSTHIFNTQAGLNTARATNNVLQIVYGSANAGVTKGGFYPNGMNGTIVSS